MARPARSSRDWSRVRRRASPKPRRCVSGPMRDAETLNDHLDADYDRAVLDRLGSLHDEAVALLTPLESANPRLADYCWRLGRAIGKAQGGDHRYVASPRVDSYHGVWFELH